MLKSECNRIVMAGIKGTAYELEILELAIRSYGQVLRSVAERHYSLAEFAAKIEAVYDVKTPQTGEVVRVLRLLHEANPPRTYYIVPAWSDQAGQCRIVSREGLIPDAHKSYQAAPGLWKEAGLMNSLGRLVCLSAGPEVQEEFRACEPLMAGTVIYG